MAQAANLVLKNASAVNVTYGPRLIRTGEIASYTDQTAGLSDAVRSKATLTLKESATVRTVEGKVTYPERRATGELDTAFGTFMVKSVHVMTPTAKLEVLSRLRAMIDDAIVTAAVDSGETPW